MTGKNKEQFEEWYNEEMTYPLGNLYNGFYSLDHEFQEGVIKAYYYSLGIEYFLTPISPKRTRISIYKDRFDYMEVFRS